ncbi:SxtJ family membrane protein [Candidatus Kapabacteria bacterium]|nr:SxtJ family membrane protein [Candidatus Kapabacteria bacterium]
MKTKTKLLRTFGLIWASIIAIIIPYKFDEISFLNIYTLTTATIFVVFSFFWQKPIKYIYKYQMFIASFIGNITSKLILGLIFYLVITPIGILQRTMGQDLLNKKIDKQATSYWITRKKQAGKLTNQF